MSNPIDELQSQRQLEREALDQAVERHSIALVAALSGLCKRIDSAAEREERSIIMFERLVNTLDRLELTERGLTQELAAQRSMRVQNGHD